MPYRRIPKTDPTRISALQQLVSMEGYKENGMLVLSYQTIRDAQLMLSKFRHIQSQYQQYHDQFARVNKLITDEARTARMYVQHFMRVLLMTVQREELHVDILADYGLDINSPSLPSLAKGDQLVQWGKRIIEAEERRISKGGIPLYNPNIAKLKVHYNIFADHHYSLINYKKNAEKFRQELLKLRPIVDDMMLDLWNQVDNFYADRPMNVRISSVAKFGVIYYMHDREKKRIEGDKLQNKISFHEES